MVKLKKNVSKMKICWILKSINIKPSSDTHWAKEFAYLIYQKFVIKLNN